MILDLVRQAECERSWRTMLIATDPSRTPSWHPEGWACHASCLNTLGMFTGLQERLETHRREIARDRETRSFSIYIAGRMHQSRGDYDIALAAYMRASAIATSPEMRALTRIQTGAINFALGEYSEASDTLQSVLADDPLDAFSAAHALDLLADIAIRTEAFDLAQKHVRAARTEAERAGNLYRLDWVTFSEGEIAYETDREVGLRLMGQAWHSFVHHGAASSALHCSHRLGERLLALKRYGEARDVLDTGLRLAEELRFNTSCAAILRLAAQLDHRTHRITREELDAAMKRAEILQSRGHKALSTIHGRAHIYSEAEVEAFVATLDPRLFEILCLRILEHEGLQCELTARDKAVFDILAEQRVGTAHDTLRWGVSCKRVKDGVGVWDLPYDRHLRTEGCGGLMLMTSGRPSPEADQQLASLRRDGFQVDVWNGARIQRYLLEHDWIMAEVGHRESRAPVGKRPR